MLSADNLCKQFGPRSGSKLFDTLMVFLKEFLKKLILKKNQQTTKKHKKSPSRQFKNKSILFSLYSSIYPSAYSTYCVPLYLGGSLDSTVVDFPPHQNVAQQTFSPLQVGIDLVITNGSFRLTVFIWTLKLLTMLNLKFE